MERDLCTKFKRKVMFLCVCYADEQVRLFGLTKELFVYEGERAHI